MTKMIKHKNYTKISTIYAHLMVNANIKFGVRNNYYLLIVFKWIVLWKIKLLNHWCIKKIKLKTIQWINGLHVCTSIIHFFVTKVIPSLYCYPVNCLLFIYVIWIFFFSLHTSIFILKIEVRCTYNNSIIK